MDNMQERSEIGVGPDAGIGSLSVDTVFSSGPTEHPDTRARLLRKVADGLLEDMLVPGLAGQSRIHARLEDLGSALRWLREHASELSVTERASIAEAIGHCQTCLRQTDALFGALQGWLRQRELPAQANADYGNAVGHRGRQRPDGSKYNPSVEASG
jgi:hypothetical protein